MTISSYNTAADKINWQNQKEMYQQGHDFFLNYHQLYADNKNNDIGQFLDLHYSLVTNYKGGKIKASANYGDLQAQARKEIMALELIFDKVSAKEQAEIKKYLMALKMVA
jgi:hypothetical protein